MNKIIILSLFFILSCSLNQNSKFWTKTQKAEIDNSVIKILFKENKLNSKEFNNNLKINLPKIKKNPTYINSNNDGYVNFVRFKENYSKYKFKKIKKFSNYEPELLVNSNSLFFFDDKGTLIKFDKNADIIWKNNYYSKFDKKSEPILFLASEKNNIFIADSVANYYVVDSISGNLKWKKKHSSSFNSQIKIKDGNAFVVDLQNTLRCISIKNGKIVWSVPTSFSVVSSQKKQSIIIVKNYILFTNTLGDVTAVDYETGDIIWQTPTETVEFAKNISLRTSDLISDGKTIYLSNNKNNFFAIDLATGIIKWKQNINSEIRPVIISNYLITITNEGLLVVLEKNNGNIVRINNILKNIKPKKKNAYYPVGFIVGNVKIYLTTMNGRLFILNFKNGSVEKILKLDKEKLQRPKYFNGKLYIAKDNSIIQIN